MRVDMDMEAGQKPHGPISSRMYSVGRANIVSSSLLSVVQPETHTSARGEGQAHRWIQAPQWAARTCHPTDGISRPLRRTCGHSRWRGQQSAHTRMGAHRASKRELVQCVARGGSRAAAHATGSLKQMLGEHPLKISAARTPARSRSADSKGRHARHSPSALRRKSAVLGCLRDLKGPSGSRSSQGAREQGAGPASSMAM